MTDNNPVKLGGDEFATNGHRISSMHLLQGIQKAVEKLVTDEKIDTEDVAMLAEMYNRVGTWLGSGGAFPRDIYAERMRMADEYQMGDEMI